MMPNRSPRRGTSLSTRLTRMNLLVSGTVLLIAAFAFFTYNLLSFRSDVIRNLDVEAQIVGENTVSALLFNDQQSAATTLKALERSPNVVSAVLVAPDGSTFASYGAPLKPNARHLGPDEADHVWPSGNSVLVAHSIVSEGKTVGVVYISARLNEIRQRSRQYFIIACMILLVCMAAAAAISLVFRRLVARPIIALADTALAVSRDRDYAVRAVVQSSSSEIAVLVGAFNTMLAQIQERDAALNEARTHLELRVAQRTEELQAAMRELEAFSYTVAHDLRGPLDTIAGIAFLLSNSPSATQGENADALLEQLKLSTTNMGALIDDLLNFARASSAAVNAVPTDLSAIARTIAAELTASDPSRHVDFVIEDTPEVLADPGLMRIVVDNLLRNAWKYTSRHARATIEFGRKKYTDGQPPSGSVFFVRDDGAGFDPTYAERLFRPFQRLHGTSEFPGTGIGLATVQRILARQGGTIHAQGAVDKGAAFYFSVGGPGAAARP